MNPAGRNEIGSRGGNTADVIEDPFNRGNLLLVIIVTGAPGY